MSQESHTEYHYEMVINIVAEIIIEYINTNICDKNVENLPIIECNTNGDDHDSCYPSKQVA